MNHRNIFDITMLFVAFQSHSQCAFNNFFNSTITLEGGNTSTVQCVQGGQYIALDKLVKALQ